MHEQTSEAYKCISKKVEEREGTIPILINFNISVFLVLQHPIEQSNIRDYISFYLKKCTSSYRTMALYMPVERETTALKFPKSIQYFSYKQKRLSTRKSAINFFFDKPLSHTIPLNSKYGNQRNYIQVLSSALYLKIRFLVIPNDLNFLVEAFHWKDTARRRIFNSFHKIRRFNLTLGRTSNSNFIESILIGFHLSYVI